MPIRSYEQRIISLERRADTILKVVPELRDLIENLTKVVKTIKQEVEDIKENIWDSTGEVSIVRRTGNSSIFTTGMSNPPLP